MDSKPASFKRVVVTGYYGMSNYGDDLFVRAVNAAISRYYECITPLYPHLEFSRQRRLRFFSQLYASPTRAGAVSRIAALAWLAMQADAIVFAGGSTIANSPRRRLLATVAALKPLPLIAVGVSVGPFSSSADRAAALEWYRKFVFVSTRDTPSFETLRNAGIPGALHAGADIAPMAFQAVKRPQREDRNAQVIVNIGPLPAGRQTISNLQQGILDEVAAYCIAANRKCLVVSFNSHPAFGDNSAAIMGKEYLVNLGVSTGVLLYGQGDTAEFEQVLALSHCVVSYRLHGVVAALSLGVPAIALNYHPKVRAVLLRIGFPSEFILGLDLPQGHLLNTLRQAVSQSPSMLDAAMNRALALAESAFEELAAIK